MSTSHTRWPILGALRAMHEEGPWVLFPFGSARATRLPLSSPNDDERPSPRAVVDHGWSRKAPGQGTEISANAAWNCDDPALLEAPNELLARVHAYTKIARSASYQRPRHTTSFRKRQGMLELATPM